MLIGKNVQDMQIGIKINKGRETVAYYYNEEFKDSVAQVAGETSIDI